MSDEFHKVITFFSKRKHISSIGKYYRKPTVAKFVKTDGFRDFNASRK